MFNISLQYSIDWILISLRLSYSYMCVRSTPKFCFSFFIIFFLQGPSVTLTSLICLEVAPFSTWIVNHSSTLFLFNSLLNLVSEVIKGGIKEYGESYLDYDNTLKLLAICNLEPSAIKRNLRKLLDNEKLGV